MPTLTLLGCTPVPLAHYLKALGVFRLVSEQSQPDARAQWSGEFFSLTSNLDEEALISFLESRYQPTPILAPWNGGSGFHPGDNSKALQSIEEGQAIRLSDYRAGLREARKSISRLGISEKPEKTTKALLLQECRNTLPEAALSWLDAVVVLGSEGAKYPPLLGTGGNDGRLEFTNNFMQRIVEVMDPDSGSPNPASRTWIRAALFGTQAPTITTKVPIGQFFPGAAGGANSTSGFDGPSTVNPWDFILMIEGAILFAAASVKRMESNDDSTLAYPFCVRQTGAGYASAAASDESEARCEMWMPLWCQPTELAELKAVLGEGRAQVRGRSARSGVDFAQAVVTLGVDRGIDAFQRFGFQVRNGLAYFATPLERLPVRRNARADLLADIESWFDRLKYSTGPRAKPEAPASVRRASNLLDREILDLCRSTSRQGLLSVLLALGTAERAIAGSLRWTVNSTRIAPLAGLRSRWIAECSDDSPEFRLACALAGLNAYLPSGSLHLREHLEPVSIRRGGNRGWAQWLEHPTNDLVWHDGDFVDSLSAILLRRVLRFRQSGTPGWPDRSPTTARLEDITAFIEGRTNDRLLADLLWGLVLVDPPQDVSQRHASSSDAGADREFGVVEMAPDGPPPEPMTPSSFYALLKLCFSPARASEVAIPVVPEILHRAISGDGASASILAARRLRGSGRAPLISKLPVSGDLARRTAAAILFPISNRDQRFLEQSILKPIR
jgi:CRISPR-associated protein Csx17